MITGYNTDVPYKDFVFHVQTEDKGLANPFIESLVYVGGRVLVAKRASYADKLAQGSSEKDIIALMDRQHRTMIAAIRHGKFDDKLAVLVGDQTVAGETGSMAVPLSPVLDQELVELEEDLPLAASVEPLLPGFTERTLDQVILEYLAHEAEQEQLVLILQDSRDVMLGKTADLVLHARSSRDGRGVPDTEVTVKMISTASEPRVLGNSHADPDGVVHLQFQIPYLARGTSALIINATSSIGRAELKQLL
jgi:hypothetical protein